MVPDTLPSGASMLKRATRVTPTLLRNLQPLRHEQVRTTVVVKRVHTPHLSKIWAKTPRTLRSRHYIYEYDEITEVKKKEPLDVILMDVVEGLGNKWDIVSVTPVYGLTQLIVPGLAIYATPDNLALREKMKQDKTDLGPVYSSRFAPKTMRLLKALVVKLPMNKEVGWTVEPWHLRMALRQAGVVVPEDSIELPETPISGPDVGKENKVFAATILINKADRVPVLFRIQHVSRKLLDEVVSEVPYDKLPVEALLPDQRDLLRELAPDKVVDTAGS
ncbi:hypothetical protein HPB47_028040 [Ixodes persulcatus]|uniref:Uncharacterized protein n=1 Tax=Ixodes persulcatus TaxID=34615 RepID=A0AC60PW60_IXOPE|nr:hypothetical protein HPB47_028040 [Ixodes persulcatus]